VFVPRYELGEAFTTSGTSDDQGSFTASFDVDDAFARAALQRLEDRTDPPHDVAGVLEVRIRVAGLDRRVPYVGGIGLEQSVNLLPADARPPRPLPSWRRPESSCGARCNPAWTATSRTLRHELTLERAIVRPCHVQSPLHCGSGEPGSPL
jgi:hypothetical protein